MRIQLTAAHEHAGVTHPAGSSLDLPEADARWLIGKGLAKGIAQAATPAKRTKQSTTEEQSK